MKLVNLDVKEVYIVTDAAKKLLEINRLKESCKGRISQDEALESALKYVYDKLKEILGI